MAILRWKYNADEKKTSLLSRVNLVTGRIEGNSQPPAVFKEEALLKDVSLSK